MVKYSDLSYKIGVVIHAMDVIAKVQWLVLQTWCSAINLIAMDVIVQVQWCVLQIRFSLIFIRAMDVIVKVQWCVLENCVV